MHYGTATVRERLYTVTLAPLSALNEIPTVPADPITNLRPLFLLPPQQNYAGPLSAASPPVLPSHRGEQMATAAQAPATPTTTDPIQSWLARRGAVAQLHADQLDAKVTGSPAPSLRTNSSGARRAAVNRANSAHSTGPRTESGKQRSSLNALSHGLTARTASCPPRTPKPTSATSSNFSMSTPPPPPPRLNSSTKSPTPRGASTASHSSKPSCCPKTPTPNP
jgi:hypothetical protein